MKSWTTMKKMLQLAALAVIVGTSGCIGHPVGAATLGVSVEGLSAEDVTCVRVTISGPGIPEPIVRELTETEEQWRGIITGIPVGEDRIFHAVAFNAAGVPIYEGERSGLAISEGETLLVVILLQQVDHPDPFDNTVPYIDSVVASANPVAPGEEVELSVIARDVDPEDVLTYLWTASGGAFEDDAAPETIWTAPVIVGTYDLTIMVSDDRGGTRTLTFCLEVVVIEDEGTGSADVIATFNTWPEIETVTADPGRVEPTESTQLFVTAVDNDEDELSFWWSDEGGECAGTFSDIHAPNPLWSAPASLPAAGECALNVTVTDGRGGSSVGTIRIQVGEATTLNIAPKILSTYQSAIEVAAGETVELFVEASDPEGLEMSFSWHASGGALSDISSDENSSEALWLSSMGGSYEITVTVSDSQGGETVVRFTVETTGPTSDGGPIACSEVLEGSLVPAEEDVYTFEAEVGDVVNIVLRKTTSDPNFTMVLELYAPDGSRVTSASHSSVADLTSPPLPLLGMYSAVVFDAYTDTAGTYAISWRRLNAPACSATPLACNEVLSGTIEIGGKEVYTFAAEAGDVVNVLMRETEVPSTFSPVLSLYAPDGSLVRSGSHDSTVDLTASDLPLSGTYTVVAADAWADTEGSFTVSWRRRNAPVCGATPIDCNEVHSGAVVVGAKDVYVFEAEAGDVINVAMRKTSSLPTFTCALSLYAPDGSLVSSASHSSMASITSVPLAAPGTYTIVAHDAWADSEGTYGVSWRNVNAPACGATLMSSGDLLSGSLDIAEMDVYAFDATVGEVMSIRVTESAADSAFSPVIALYTPDGSLVGTMSHDSSAYLTTAPLETAGRYTIVVYDAWLDAMGDYSIGFTRYL